MLQLSPDFCQRFLVQVDASAKGIGAVLAQGRAGEDASCLPQPQATPQGDKIFENECLTIKWSLDSLRDYLLGRELIWKLTTSL